MTGETRNLIAPRRKARCPMTDAEKVTKLATAISRADRELDLILEPGSIEVGSFASGRKQSEWSLTICRRVRNILRRALAKVQAGQRPAPTQSARSADGREKEITDARN